MSRTAEFTTVLLPGLGCDAGLWRDQIEALAPHGQPRVANVHTRADTIARMADLLLAEHTGDLLLIGASMGGRIALEVARRAPDRVRGLALLGSTAREDSDEMRALRRQAIVEFEAGRGAALLDANMWFVFHRSAWDDEPLMARYRAMVARAGDAQLIRQNRAIIAMPDLRAALPRIACPTLVVCGENDAVTPPECSREMATAIPGARLEWLADCGHMLTMEKPAATSALLRDFVAGLASTRRSRALTAGAG